jgi:tetratricopeptide (TPR) repeat protein
MNAVRPVSILAVLLGLGVAVSAAYQAETRDRDYRALLNRGDAALSAGEAFDAVEAYSGAIALRPGSMLAYLRRGETYERRGDLAAAARDFRQAIAMDPIATRPREDLGDVQYRRQRYEQATEAYASVLRLDDRSAAVTYKLALARYRAGDIPAALHALHAALALDDRAPDAHYLRGMCLRAQDLPEAVEAFERAVELSPGFVEAREELADAYRALGRIDDELEQLQVLAGLDDTVTRHVAVGLAHARAQRWDLAVLTLGTALERSPDAAPIFVALGRIWLDRPRARNDRVNVAKAREALERIAGKPAATSEVLTLYGRALLQDGDTAAAERVLRLAVTRYPVDPAALLEYAEVSEHQHRLQEARRALASYVALSEGDVPPRSAARLGALSARLDDLPSAIVWWRRVVAADPEDARTITALADAQLRLGDRADAQATIAAGLERNPDHALLRALQRRTARSDD